MQIIYPEWVWYIAEFVIEVDFESGSAQEYQIQSYLIKAASPEKAYEKSLDLQGRLGDSVRDEHGQAVNYNCLGLHNLDVIQEAKLEDGLHLSTIYTREVTGSLSRPRLREKNELAIFS